MSVKKRAKLLINKGENTKSCLSLKEKGNKGSMWVTNQILNQDIIFGS